jgi:hypothetical protein
MGQYEVRHQCDDETPIPKRTCKVRPRADICEHCHDAYRHYRAYYNCQTCEENNKRYELIHVGEDFALVSMNGEIKRVALGRIRDIQEA